MSFPMTKFPLICEYLAWAQSQGCSVQTGVNQKVGRRMRTITKIISADGLRFVILSNGQHEALNTHTIQHLDRRLGVQSPWLKFDSVVEGASS